MALFSNDDQEQALCPETLIWVAEQLEKESISWMKSEDSCSSPITRPITLGACARNKNHAKILREIATEIYELPQIKVEHEW